MMNEFLPRPFRRRPRRKMPSFPFFSFRLFRYFPRWKPVQIFNKQTLLPKLDFQIIRVHFISNASGREERRWEERGNRRVRVWMFGNLLWSKVLDLRKVKKWTFVRVTLNWNRTGQNAINSIQTFYRSEITFDFFTICFGDVVQNVLNTTTRHDTTWIVRASDLH